MCLISNIIIILALIFEWNVVKCGSKNIHRTVLSSMDNIIWGDLYDQLMSMGIFILMMNKIFM